MKVFPEEQPALRLNLRQKWGTKGERACRPDSVRRAETRRDDHSSGRPVARPLEPSTRMLGRAALWRPRAPRMPIRCCSGWGLACRSCRHDRGELLPHRFTLAVGGRRTGCRLGGLLSVPLSVALGLAACDAWPLASTLPCGVRTFLQRGTKPQPAAVRLAPGVHSTRRGADTHAGQARRRVTTARLSGRRPAGESPRGCRRCSGARSW